MPKIPVRKKRSKLAVILLAPIFALVFIVGWSLYWIGQSRQKQSQPLKPSNKIPAKQDEIELIVIPQEAQLIADQ